MPTETFVGQMVGFGVLVLTVHAGRSLAVCELSETILSLSAAGLLRVFSRSWLAMLVAVVGHVICRNGRQWFSMAQDALELGNSGQRTS